MVCERSMHVQNFVDAKRNEERTGGGILDSFFGDEGGMATESAKGVFFPPCSPASHPPEEEEEGGASEAAAAKESIPFSRPNVVSD